MAAAHHTERLLPSASVQLGLQHKQQFPFVPCDAARIRMRRRRPGQRSRSSGRQRLLIGSKSEFPQRPERLFKRWRCANKVDKERNGRGDQPEWALKGYKKKGIPGWFRTRADVRGRVGQPQDLGPGGVWGGYGQMDVINSKVERKIRSAGAAV